MSKVVYISGIVAVPVDRDCIMESVSNAFEDMLSLGYEPICCPDLVAGVISGRESVPLIAASDAVLDMGGPGLASELAVELLKPAFTNLVEMGTYFNGRD